MTNKLLKIQIPSSKLINQIITYDVGVEEEVFVGGELGLEGVELILGTGAADYGVAPLGHLYRQRSPQPFAHSRYHYNPRRRDAASSSLADHVHLSQPLSLGF